VMLFSQRCMDCGSTLPSGYYAVSVG
jgi:hypothetical protein